MLLCLYSDLFCIFNQLGFFLSFGVELYKIFLSLLSFFRLLFSVRARLLVKFQGEHRFPTLLVTVSPEEEGKCPRKMTTNII